MSQATDFRLQVSGTAAGDGREDWGARFQRARAEMARAGTKIRSIIKIEHQA